MKKLLVALILSAGLAGSARAAGVETNEGLNVVQVVRSTAPIAVLAIAATATDVIISTHTGYNWVEVLNLDASAFIFCSERASVTATGAGIGWKLNVWGSFGSWHRFWIVPGTKLYCISSSGTINATVAKGR